MSIGRGWKCGVLLGLAVLSGCGREAAETTGAVEAHAPSPAGARGRMGESMSSDPVLGVQRALAALENGRLDQAYDFLPGSMQQDVDTIVQTFALRMDRELWDASIAVLRKAVEVLKVREDLILPLAQPVLVPAGTSEPPSIAELSEQWGELVAALETLAHSEITELDRLKRFSVRQFLGGTGKRVFEQVQELDVGGMNRLAELSQVKVERVPEQPRIVLRIQFPNEEQPIEQEFISVEDRWIPQPMAAGWPLFVQDALDRLDRLTPAQFAAIKPETLRRLKSLEHALDTMREARRPEEFFGAISPALEQLRGLQEALSFKAAPPGTVVVLLERELPEPEETKLLDELVQLSDNPERARYTAMKSGGRTRISISHVNDVAAFAAKITFATGKSVDEATRTIQLDAPSQK